jgi:hypothetical protein
LHRPPQRFATPQPLQRDKCVLDDAMVAKAAKDGHFELLQQVLLNKKMGASLFTSMHTFVALF